MAPVIRLRLGCAGGPQGDGARGGQARPRFGACGGGERAAGARAVRIAHEPGGRRTHASDRTGLLPSGRFGLPQIRVHLRRAARRRNDKDGGHRRRFFPELESLCETVRVLLSAARPHIGRRPAREHGPLGARHCFRIALGRRIARAHGGIREQGRGLRHGRNDAGPRDRDVRHGRVASRRPLGGGGHARLGRLRDEALPGGGERGVGAGGTHGRASRRSRLPDRGIEVCGRGAAPADGAERRTRRGRAVERRGRKRSGAQVLHRGSRRGADRIGLPGDRKTGRDLGAHAADRLRVPLRGGVPDGGPVDAHPCGRGYSAPTSRASSGSRAGVRSTRSYTVSPWAKPRSA